MIPKSMNMKLEVEALSLQWGLSQILDICEILRSGFLGMMIFFAKLIATSCCTWGIKVAGEAKARAQYLSNPYATTGWPTVFFFAPVFDRILGLVLQWFVVQTSSNKALPHTPTRLQLFSLGGIGVPRENFFCMSAAYVFSNMGVSTCDYCSSMGP